MSLKAQLEARRREYEANAESHVVDAVRRSIQALAETSLVAKAVKAGETAPCSGSDAGTAISSIFRIFSIVVLSSSAFSGATGAPFVFSN